MSASAGLTTTEERCPYLEITEKEVLCKATDWGRIQDPETKEVKQIYGSLPHAMIIHCSSRNHVTCSMFKRMKMYEGESFGS